MRKRGAGTLSYCVHTSTCGCYFLPAVQSIVGKTSFYTIDLDNIDDMKFEPILDVTDWEVQDYELLSPLAVFLSNGCRHVDALPNLPARPSGTPRSLLSWGATVAWKGLNKQQLLRLDKDEVRAVQEEQELGDILFAMIRKVLDCSDEEALDILKARCLTPNLEEKLEILNSEAVDDIMDRDGKKAVKEMSNQAEMEEQVEKNLLKTIRTKSEKLRNVSEPSKKKRKGSTKEWPGDADVTLTIAQDLLPPKAKIWSDTFCARWQVFLGKSSHSRSWSKYGLKPSLRLCVQWAWELHKAATGEECPIKGLFPAQ